MSATILKLACPDRVGLLARMTNFVAERGGNLLEVNQFTDPLNGWFFTRMAIATESLQVDLPTLRAQFAPIGQELQASWTLRDARQKMRVAIFVSKLGHCLADLLWRWHSGELEMEIPLVLSNHEQFRSMIEREGLPFLHVPIDPQDKAPGFAQVEAAVAAAGVDLIVLARYMQILPPDLCETYAGRIMNIHHSFLPSFVGANPYKKAYERGVKLIGATCHYVTSELDAGPIIDQEVVRVEHFHQPDDLLRLGRDCERLALSRGVRAHIHDRVLIHGGRTVVFRD
ncbi:MAG TPA: formyltetrahydrofolate deformylase [Chthoniobacterales bacterium]|jgi:formyltetrahydrofolate deformylase